jgi:HB1, ASXL, restriction endonuclease HTH domain
MSKSNAKPSKHDQATIGPAAAEKARRLAIADLAGKGQPVAASAGASVPPAASAGAGAVGTVGAVVGSPVPPKPTGAKGTPKGGKSGKGSNAKALPSKKEPKPKKVSGLDAVAMVLAAVKRPMNMKEVFAETQSRKLWKTNGATPEATLYAAVIREIAAKGKESRFKKHDRGLFTVGAKA